MMKYTFAKRSLFGSNDFEDIRLLVNKSLGLDISSEFNESQMSDGASTEILSDQNNLMQFELDTPSTCCTSVLHANKKASGNLIQKSCTENIETPKKLNIQRKAINDLFQIWNYTYFEHNTDFQQSSESKDEKNLVAFSKEHFLESEEDIVNNKFNTNAKAIKIEFNPDTCECDQNTSFSISLSEIYSDAKLVNAKGLKSTLVSQTDGNNASEFKESNNEILSEMTDSENQNIEILSDKSFLCLTENSKDMSLSNSFLKENVLNLEELPAKVQSHKENKNYACPRCLKQFKYPSQLKRHVRIHTIDEKEPEGNKVNKYFKPDPPIAKSVDCGSETRNFTKIKQRRGKSIQQCPYCLGTFKVPSKLLRHIKSHVGLKPYECHLCSKSFLERFNFEVHAKSHCKEQPHVCDICKRAFSIKSNLRRHLRSHMKEKSFICSECGSAYSSEKKYEFHVRNHQEKPHKCIDCGKRFKKKSNLKRHVDIHANKRHYPCNSCDYRARQNDHLKKHIERHHQI